MFWKIVIAMIVFTVSSCITSFTIATPMCCVNMGIPFSAQVQQATGVNTSKLRSMYLRTIFLWAVINLVIAICVYLFVPTFYCYMVLAGAVVTTLRGLVASGINANNIEDWGMSCRKYVNDDDFAIVIDYLQTRFQSK